MFITTLNQMGVLALFILLGFTVAKCKILPDNAAQTLSKLVNTLFIPALILETFITTFTVETLSASWKMMLFSFAAALLVIPVAILVAKLVTKDKYEQKIYTYGLSFSNFGFMGIPVVAALFSKYATEYIIFTMPLWILIYAWGAPKLLMGEEGQGLKETFKSFINPMFLSLIVGAILGILNFGAYMPPFSMTVLTSLADCMSPVAMLVTGITFSKIDFKKVFLSWGIYVVSAVRLIVLPALFAGLYILLERVLSVSFPKYYFVSLVCLLAMPLGLNTIVIPAAYGKDTSVAAGMAMISHVLAVGSIPLMLWMFL